MKNATLLILLTVLGLGVWTAWGDGTPFPPASQAEVTAGILRNKFVSPATLVGARGQGIGSFLPSSTVVQTVNLINTNDIFPFGTSTAAGTGAMHWNPNITWHDGNEVLQQGAYTNATQTMVVDVPFLNLWVIDATPMDVGAATYSFSIEANFDYTLHEFTIPQGVAWAANTGTGTFFATNNLMPVLLTNTYTIGLTNSFDFAAAVRSLPYATNGNPAQQGVRGGGTVYVPPGITFCGTNRFAYHQGFALDIEGSLGGMSVLVITNWASGASPALYFGTDLTQPGDVSTYPNITIRNLVIGHYDDQTNAVVKIQQTATLLMENVTECPFQSYFSSSQFGTSATKSTNAIGIQIFDINGQQETFNNITVANEHIGIDITADHPTMVGFNLFNCGSAAGTNSWPSNSLFSIRGVGMVNEGAIHEIYVGGQTAGNYLDYLNNEGTSIGPIYFVGGDTGESEISGDRSATVSPTGNSMRFSEMNSFSAAQGFDRMIKFTGTNYDVSITNNPGVVNDTVIGIGTKTSLVYSVGGSPVMSFTNGWVATYGTNTVTVTSTGLTNISSGNLLVSVTAGTGLVIKDGNGNQFLAPVLGNAFLLKPGWRLTGTAVTGIAVQQ